MKNAAYGDAAGAKHSGAAETSLPLATRINALHHEVEEHKNRMLMKARAAGELLLEAKDTVKHGKWEAWLEANFVGSGRTARAYMRIARRWDVIEAKRQSAADLSIAAALKLVRYGYKGRGA